MVFEFAVEPELVATWTTRENFRYFFERFGLGQERAVSRFPKRWKALVFEAFTGTGDIERKRLEELVARLSERMVQRRNAGWDAERSWLENAETEHKRIAFHAILARGNPRARAFVHPGESLDHTVDVWTLRRALSVRRSSAQMASAVASMLRGSSVAIFIDPYFGPERPRHRRPLQAFLRSLTQDRPGIAPVRIEIHTAAENTGTLAFFRGECAARLPSCVPDGLTVTLRRFSMRPGGERLHNRYILTDLGGVTFGIGLDEGDGEDEIFLMDRAVYERRWQSYASNSIAFNENEPPVIVVGTLR